MARLTPYQIAKKAEDCPTAIGSIRIINRLFRAQDDSRLAPVFDRFNVTERAIRRVRRMQLDDWGLGYALTLHEEIGKIANSEW